MKKLKEKLKKNGGFTLIEMLIVVAIIAILIAISIPMVSVALEKARIATDAANERAAKAEILMCYMTDSKFDGTNKVSTAASYAYNAETGALQTTAPSSTYGKCADHKDKFITISVTDNSEVFMAWASTLTTGTALTANGADLCGLEVNK